MFIDKMKKKENKSIQRKIFLISLLTFIFIFMLFSIYFQVKDNGITGNYLIGAESVYSGGVATGDSSFRILSPDVTNLNLILIIEIVIAIAVFVVLMIIAKSYRDEIGKRKSYRNK